ncbi:hypothetical protein [Sphingomonas insulae]|nr:hypothetical protein [Sphingomonas insulae]
MAENLSRAKESLAEQARTLGGSAKRFGKGAWDWKREAMQAFRGWTRTLPQGVGAAVWRTLFAIIVVGIGLRFVDRMLFPKGAGQPAATYELVAVAAVVSTVATAVIVLIDQPDRARQSRDRRASRDAGRFWLMCFALVVGTVLSGDIIRRLPPTIAPAWLTAERPSNECKSEIQDKARGTARERRGGTGISC